MLPVYGPPCQPCPVWAPGALSDGGVPGAHGGGAPLRPGHQRRRDAGQDRHLGHQQVPLPVLVGELSPPGALKHGERTAG